MPDDQNRLEWIPLANVPAGPNGCGGSAIQAGESCVVGSLQIANTGRNPETMAIGSVDGTIYTTDSLTSADPDETRIGRVDPATAEFFPLPSEIGSGTGTVDPLGNDGGPYPNSTLNFTDVDGLAFDPETLVLWATDTGASQSESDSDTIAGQNVNERYLFAIDTATGALIQDQFGPGIDFIAVTGSDIGADDQVDDITIDPTQRSSEPGANELLLYVTSATDLYTVARSGTNAGRLNLVTTITNASGGGALDMEGLSVDTNGQLYGTTGTSGAPANSLFRIDKVTGVATLIGVPGAASGTDYEAIGCLFLSASVPISLSSFVAEQVGGDQVLFKWTTGTETANVGFYLQQETDNGWRRINEQLIPSHFGDSLAPQTYEYLASGVMASRFRIVDVDIKQKRRHHGPFTLDQQYGQADTADAIDWETIRSEHKAKRNKRKAKRRAHALQRVAKASERRAARAQRKVERRAERLLAKHEQEAATDNQVVPNTYPVYELRVDETGIYRVSYQELAAAGLDLDGVPVGDIALTRGSTPVRIRVDSSGETFGPGSFIEFYGQALETLYTRTNVYQLRVDAELARRVRVNGAPPPRRGSPVAFYMEVLDIDDNLMYSFGSPSGDPWYKTRMLAFAGAPVTNSYTLNVDNLVPGVSDSKLYVGLWGVTSWPGTPDHHVEVSLNNQSVWDDTFDGVVDAPVTVNLDQGLLQEGANTLQITVPGDTGFDFDLVNLDRYGITYPRAFVARQGRLSFAGQGRLFEVNGLTSGDVVVYRFTGKQGQTPVFQSNVKVDRDANGFSARFRGNSNRELRYLVSTVDELLTPEIEPLPEENDITSGDAEYLIITHPSFIDGLDPLVAARRAMGLSVKVVDVKDVYRQFYDGIVDPEAIRRYVAYAVKELGAKLLLIVGGDTFDYFDYSGSGSMSFVPTPYTQTSDIVRYTPADPLLTDTDRDGFPDLPIGRFPVRTGDELASIIAKTLDYEIAGHNGTAVFAADDAEPGVSFSTHSDSLIQGLSEHWQVNKAYIDELGAQAARDTLIDSINAGVALTSFFGHSGPTAWTFDNLFTATDAEQLTNAGRPTIVTQWGCWNTYYVAPSNNTLGHKFLLSGDQGAAAVLGASTLTMAESEALIGPLVIKYAVQSGVTLGQAVQKAKTYMIQNHPDMLDVILGWTLLGDPALTVNQ